MNPLDAANKHSLFGGDADEVRKRRQKAKSALHPNNESPCGSKTKYNMFKKYKNKIKCVTAHVLRTPRESRKARQMDNVRLQLNDY